MQRFENFCVERFDIDPTPTRAAMLEAAGALRLPPPHAGDARQAGLRTTGGSNLTPFPEELNRELISKVARCTSRPGLHDLHLALLARPPPLHHPPAPRPRSWAKTEREAISSEPASAASP
jgi:hypothetical protein